MNETSRHHNRKQICLREKTSGRPGNGSMRRPFFYVPPLQADFCRLLSLARADTHTRPTTHIHLSVLPHGGCRPDLRPKCGAFWLFSRLPGGRATGAKNPQQRERSPIVRTCLGIVCLPCVRTSVSYTHLTLPTTPYV